MNERIKALRSALNLTQADFGNRINVSQVTIAGYEACRREPTDRVISDICREFNVSEEWLRTGSGDMFVQRTRNQEIGLFVNEVMQDENDAFRKRFITMLSSLSVEEWQVLEKMAQKMVEGR